MKKDCTALAQQALELAGKATPGEWFHDYGKIGVDEHGIGEMDHAEDAEFIAFARTALPALAERCLALEEALRRTRYIAEHLYQMIDRDTWRATGGDDGQGHYEGDYRAEQIGLELRELAALAAEEQT
jgi:hypothetical protein